MSSTLIETVSEIGAELDDETVPAVVKQFLAFLM
jgi:hypothetical protein